MREINIKPTWESIVYKYLRILFNPHTSIDRKQEQDMIKQLLHVGRMADLYVKHVKQQEEGEE
jgi:hypothetical protein